MVAHLDPAGEPSELERIAAALESIAERLEALEVIALGEASALADVARRLEPLEALLERYGPLLAAAESRMNAGPIARMRGVPRAQNKNAAGG